MGSSRRITAGATKRFPPGQEDSDRPFEEPEHNDREQDR